MDERVSVIATVFNEGVNVRRLLDSLAAQTRPADEIVIVDGGSSDDTVGHLRAYEDQVPLQVIEEPGANISQGRNIAVTHATGDILAITDAGVTLPPDWLERLTAPFDGPEPPDVVSGFFAADPHTVFEAAMGATVLPLEGDIDPDTFLPSSRSVAVRKAAFEAVNGYPAWLDYCEDLIFDMNLKARYPFGFAPDACVAFRPRETWRDFFVQYYRYARGDGKADLWRKRHAIRYITYLVAGPLLLWLALAVHPLFGLVLLAGLAAYTRRPYARLPHVMRRYAESATVTPTDWLRAAAYVPLIRVVGDVAKMIGYPVGWRWRLRENPPDWRV
jgi:glycosyltransferase involved in cell wall biosynthesis